MKKKIGYLAIVVAIVFSFIGCGKNKTNEQDINENRTIAEAKEAKEDKEVEEPPHKVLSGSHDLDGNKISTEIYMDANEHFDMRVSLSCNSDDEAAALIGAYCIYLNESVEDMDTLDEASLKATVEGTNHVFNFNVDKEKKSMSGVNEDGSEVDGFPDWLVKVAVTCDIQQKIEEMTNNISNAFYDATVVGM